MGRSSMSYCGLKENVVVGRKEEEEIEVKRGAWTREEDEKLISFIQRNHGHHGTWKTLPKLAGLRRCGKSCRLRWTNYLRPNIRRGGFSVAEERTILHLHSLLGNRWSSIALHLSGRTDNDVKNYWNTHLKKRLVRSGIDPETHQPILPQSRELISGIHNGAIRQKIDIDPSVVSHMLQWELVRLQAESKVASPNSNSTTDYSSHYHLSRSSLNQSQPPIFHRACDASATQNEDIHEVAIQMSQYTRTSGASHNLDQNHQQQCPSSVHCTIQESDPQNTINHDQFSLQEICSTQSIFNEQTFSLQVGVPLIDNQSCKQDSIEMNSCSGSTSTNYNNTSTVTTPDYQCTTSIRSEDNINQSLSILENSSSSDLMSSLIPTLVSCEDNIHDYWATLLCLLSNAPNTS